MRRAFIRHNLIMLVSLSVLLTGCWDREEIEEQAYVIGMGLDESKEKDKIDVTFLIANPEVGSLQGGGGTNEPPSEIVTITASDFVSAKNTANTVISRNITYDFLQVIIVSEKLAKRKDFIRRIYSTTKDREIRRSTYLGVSKEKASQFINQLEPKLETRPHKYFQYTIRNSIEKGLIADATLQRFFKITELDADLFLGIYMTTEKNKKTKQANEDEYTAGQLDIQGKTNSSQVIGSAVFKEGRMIGKLTGEETRLSVLLSDEFEMSDVLTTYTDPFDSRYRITVRMMKDTSNQIEMDLKRTVPRVHIQIPLTLEVLSNPSMIDYTREKNKRILKKHLERVLEKEINDFIGQTQKKLKGSPFSLSLYARKHFRTLPEY
ncbi:MAG TPA: Ger(x)C family spore germination protein, partial [Chondromyces sp.]|nr:Ger(x)C family spore germination protein [Chondromyces sp.]